MKNLSILKRQLLSEVIDLSICFIPTVMAYFFTGFANQYSYINILTIFGMIYILYAILSTFISNGQSIGDLMTRIILIRITSIKKSKILYFTRAIIKSIAILHLSLFNEFNYIYIAIYFLLLFPFKFSYSGYLQYTMLSFGSRTTFVDINHIQNA